jgi:MFS family permease
MARLFLVLGIGIQAVVVGWQVYDITKSEFSLGLVGLAEALPFIATSLFGGHLADLYNRKKIVFASNLLYLFCALLLAIISFYGAVIFKNYGVLPIYAIIAVAGLSRGFLAPAQGALIPQLVKKEELVYASTIGSITFYFASIVGCAVGGVLCASIGTANSYLIVVALSIIGLFKILQIEMFSNLTKTLNTMMKNLQNFTLKMDI